MLEIAEVKNEVGIGRTALLAEIIWREYYAPILPEGQIDYMLDKYQSAEAIGRQLQEGYRYFLARDDGSEFGYFAIKPNGEDLFISKLYVLSLARRRGIGKACVTFIEELARADGFKTLSLTVNKSNASSVEAYKRMGFSVGGEGVSDIGGGFVMDDYYMNKRLS